MNYHQKLCLLFSLLLSTEVLITESKRFRFHLPLLSNNRHLEFDSRPTRLCPKDLCPLQEDDEYSVTNEKRIVAAILFGVSVITSLANIGLDIYLKIEGCCGIQPKLCEYKTEFQSIRDELVRRAGEMDDQYLATENVLAYLKSTNRHNQVIGLNVKRIMELTGRVIGLLDPSLEEKLSNKTFELKKELEKHNETVRTFTSLQINFQYQSVFSTVQSTLVTLSPIIGTIGAGMLAVGFHWVKAAKLASSAQGLQLANSAKLQNVLGVSSVNKFASQTINAQNGAIAATSKLAKFAKFAGAALSVITIAVDIWMGLQKLDQCRKMRDEAKKAVDRIKPERTTFEATERELKELHENVTTNYDLVKGEITSEAFLKYATQIRQMASSADNSPDYLKIAANNISTFIDGIKTADKAKTVELQQMLTSALDQITFSWSCYENKIKTISYVRDNCKTGKGSLEFLWLEAVTLYETNARSCTTTSGHDYTTYAATKQYVDDQMNEGDYQTDCILNNRDFFGLTCLYWADDYKADVIATKTGLSQNQTNYFLSKCPLQDVTPQVAKLVCAFKTFQTLEEILVSYSKYDPAQITQTYKTCK